ncbi:MAG: hypothetical protein ACREFE_13985, partial [Limisphaerales bacterium]
MTIPKFTTDIVIRRLRWVVLLVMLADGAITLVGQPPSFWHDSRNTNEIEPVVRFFLARGAIPYIVVGLIYGFGALFIASILPRRLGLTLLFFLLLEHFWGMTSWCIYYFGVSIRLHDAFELCIAALITFSIFKPTPKHDRLPPNT